MNQVPPLDIEQAIDLVLALPAHRSQNPQHAAFGQLLLQEYFVKLRERYIGDECAIGYLDNLFACIASAVRAFSVERDILGTRWQSMLEQRKREIERANRLDRFSPFREDGVWGKALAIIGGAGGGAIAGEMLKSITSSSNVFVAGSVLLGSIFGLFLVDLALDLVRNRMMERIERQFPQSLLQTWRSETIVNYKKILKQFLWSAIRIKEEWYPGLSTFDGKMIYTSYQIPHFDFHGEQQNAKVGELPPELETKLSEIIDGHMALG
jgi:hypothetical protein